MMSNSNSTTSKNKINVKGTSHIVSYDKFPHHYSYRSSGYKTIRMSNNISAVCFVGDLNNNLRQQLVSAYVNENIWTLLPSCFYNCTNMTAVNNDNLIRSVGDYAFYNCSSLKSINFLDNNNKDLYTLGRYAFSKSGISSITLNLKSSVSDTSYGEYCFNECTLLKSVTLLGAPYLSYHMFDGCTNLTSITLNDKHSYVYPYCFANCTSLQSVKLPANLYMLSPHMFDGCTNLTSVTFDNNSILKQIGDNVFANCSNLKELTLPNSINSLSLIDPEFLGGSSIDTLTFSGLSDDVFVNEVKTKEANVTLTSIITDTGIFLNTVKESINKNIPIIIIKSTSWCGYCKQYKREILNTTQFKQFLLTSNYCIGGLSDDSNVIKALKEIGVTDSSSAIPLTWWYWKKPDGKVVSKHIVGYDSSWTVDSYINMCKNNFSGYSPEIEVIKFVIKEEITTFGKGTGLSVTYVSSTGNKYICANDSIVKAPTYRVDKYTNSNFKYGIWYYNIKELHKYADDHNLPLLVEWSSKGCDPCIDFLNNTWNNSKFQEAIKTKKCLFGRVEISGNESWDSPVNSLPYYVSHILGSYNVLIPQLVFYWKKSATLTYKEVWNYNYRTDPANANYNTVLNKLNNMLGSYEGSTDYVAPTVYLSENTKFLYYSNETDDNNGKYFICDNKTYTTSYNGTLDIDITDSTYPVIPITASAKPHDETMFSTATLDSNGKYTSIHVSDVVTMPKYTYLYFTTPDKSNFKDLYGVIFKVSDLDFCGDYRIYQSGSKWYYMRNDQELTAEEVAAKTVKRAIAYIYTFENFEEVEIHNEKQAKFANGIIHDCSDSTAANGFNEIIDEKINEPVIPVIIFENNSDDTSINSLLNNSTFKNWYSRQSYTFVRVLSNSWNSNAPQALRTFETAIQFKDNTVGSNLPKILVFKACKSCGAGSYGDIRARRTIAYDSSKDVSYYTTLISQYAALERD